MPKNKILLPVGFPPAYKDDVSKTRLFLTKKQEQRMKKDLSFAEQQNLSFTERKRSPSGAIVSGPEVAIRCDIGNYWSGKASFLLTTMSQSALAETKIINKALAKRGIPTQEILEDYPRNNGERIVLIKKAGVQSLYRIAAQTRGLKVSDAEGYFRALGTLHSLKLSHGHAHIANFFRTRKGKIGVFDFSKVERKKPDFSNAASIEKEFHSDYIESLSILMAMARSNSEIERIIAEGKAKQLIAHLTEPLPSSTAVKAELTEIITKRLYDFVIPELRKQGYFRMFAGTFKHLKP